MIMSTEVNSLENQSEPSKVSHQQKVDINILLNRVRHEKKKREKRKSFIFRSYWLSDSSNWNYSFLIKL